MPTKRGGYYLNGKRIPSVTTVLKNIGWSSGGLMHWAWALGCEGKDYREARQTAASIGTYAHQMAEDFILSREFLPPAGATKSELEHARTAFGAFEEYWLDSKLTVVGTELQLIHPKLRYGGTCDWIARRPDGRFCLPDVKTSKALYPDYLSQIVAYGEAWEYQHPDMILDGGFYILKFGKEDGNFTNKWFSRASLEPAWCVFKLALGLEQHKKAVEALCK